MLRIGFMLLKDVSTTLDMTKQGLDPSTTLRITILMRSFDSVALRLRMTLWYAQNDCSYVLQEVSACREMSPLRST